MIVHKEIKFINDLRSTFYEGLVDIFKSAINEGCFKYQFHVESDEFAEEMLQKLILENFARKTLIVLLDEDKNLIIGFTCCQESYFCGNYFVDGIFTYILPKYRGRGLSHSLRFQLLNVVNIDNKIIRFSLQNENEISKGSIVSFLSQIKNNNSRKVGSLYEIYK